MQLQNLDENYSLESFSDLLNTPPEDFIPTTAPYNNSVPPPIGNQSTGQDVLAASNNNDPPPNVNCSSGLTFSNNNNGPPPIGNPSFGQDMLTSSNNNGHSPTVNRSSGLTTSNNNNGHPPTVSRHPHPGPNLFQASSSSNRSSVRLPTQIAHRTNSVLMQEGGKHF